SQRFASLRASLRALFPEQRTASCRRVRFEEESIGPSDAEMADLLCPDPVRERAALYAMHHDLPVRIDSEGAPVTKVVAPCRRGLIRSCQQGIVMFEPCRRSD